MCTSAPVDHKHTHTHTNEREREKKKRMREGERERGKEGKRVRGVNTGMPARYTCVTKVPAVICSSLVQSSASVKFAPVATCRAERGVRAT